MPSKWSRRTLVHGIGATFGVGMMSGCLSGQPPAGALVITNDHSETHTVTVTVTKTSEDNDDLVEYNETPPTDATPVWTRTEEFTVDADERLTQRQFITEPGAFHLEAQLATGERDTNWVGYYEAAGGGVAADTVFVEIEGTGHLDVYAAHSD